MAAVVPFPLFPFLPAPLKGEREFREIPHVPFFPVSGISGKQTATHWGHVMTSTKARAYFIGRAMAELPKLKGENR